MPKRKESRLSSGEVQTIINCIRVAREKFMEDSRMFAQMLENGQANDNALITADGAKRLHQQFAHQADECEELEAVLLDCDSIMLCNDPD